MFEVKLVVGSSDTRLGVRQWLLAHLMHGVLVAEVVSVVKRTSHGHRRV